MYVYLRNKEFAVDKEIRGMLFLRSFLTNKSTFSNQQEMKNFKYLHLWFLSMASKMTRQDN